MTLTPQQISQCIDNGKFSDAESGIIHFILFNVNEKNELNVVAPSNALENNAQQNSAVLESICNNYVTVISKLFCHPRYSPRDEIIATFLSYKFVIDWLFSASMWKNTDAIIEHLGLAQLDRFGQIKVHTNRKKVTLLLALVCLGSKFRLPWKFLFKANPAIALSSYIGLVTQSIPALSVATSKGFNYLLESAKDLPILDLPEITDLGKLNYGYFNCSYATSPQKYEFKKWLTTLIRHNTQQWLDDEVRHYIDAIPKSPIASIKPKIAVMLELYKKNHAMHRCFDGIFHSLAEHFELCAFIDNTEADAADLSVFDRVVTLKGVFDINENAKCIIREKPDVIFYPSIGMKFWGIYLSQLRLAPVQIMMGGHPSSSFSPAMDKLVILGKPPSVADLQTHFSEHIVTSEQPFKDTTTHYLHSDLTPEFLSKHSAFLTDDSEFRVGVNGVLTKVTDDIIDVCKEIQKRVTKKVTFVFFSAHKSNQLAYIAAKKQLATELKHVDLVCFSAFLAYMEAISQCHFLLPTLPFGGSNSNIDAMVLKKPKLYLKGAAQIYTQCDQWEWERLDLANALACDTTEELVEKSVRLIDDAAYRVELHSLLSEKCTLEKICGVGNQADKIASDVFSKIMNQTNLSGTVHD